MRGDLTCPHCGWHGEPEPFGDYRRPWRCPACGEVGDSEAWGLTLSGRYQVDDFDAQIRAEEVLR